MCWTVSPSWSQRGQSSGWGRPLLANLSAVQHLFMIANQRKTLHLFGAHDFQSLFHGSKVTEPWKEARYADFAEWEPPAFSSLNICIIWNLSDHLPPSG
jgi:hypothetical protein